MIGVGSFCKMLLVAGLTFCRGALVSIGVTGNTIQNLMGSRQWELGCIMVKSHRGITSGVTSQARIVLIGISSHQLVSSIGLWIFMTNDTRSHCIVAWICMAGGTTLPCTLVFSRIYWKIFAIVFPIIHGLPPRSKIVTLLTISIE